MKPLEVEFVSKCHECGKICLLLCDNCKEQMNLNENPERISTEGILKIIKHLTGRLEKYQNELALRNK